MSVQRLSPLDASFLYSEDGASHNDIGMVLVLDGPALDHAGLVAAVARRIALVPRFRQRLRHLPFAAALPVWIDDPGFTMERHVVDHPAVPEGPDPVGAAVSEVMSGPLDLTLPLWQIHRYPGLPEDRWLVVVRMHHAMVDGVTSMEIVRVLLSPSVEGDPPVPDRWFPAPEPTDQQLLATAAADAARAAAELAGSLLGGARPPAAPPEPVDVGALLRPGLPIDADVMNGPVGYARRWGMVDLPLATVKAIRARHGGTVNDVILAVCAHALSSLVGSFGGSPGSPADGRVVRAMVPVSLRSAGGAGGSGGSADGGNNIGAMVVELPLGDLPAAARLERIREQTEAFKRLKEAVPAPEINPGGELMSPLTLMLGTRLAAYSPTVVNTVITNVPGPQTPLYLSGRRLHRLGACIALWTPLRIAVSVLSYDGMATVGVVTDAASFPDVEPLLAGIRSGVRDLEDGSD